MSAHRTATVKTLVLARSGHSLPESVAPAKDRYRPGDITSMPPAVDPSLDYLINRYYDPATQQYITVDPAVAATGQPYTYVGGDPVNAVDPLGLSWWNPTTWTAKTWATVGGVTLGVAAAVTGVGVVAEAAGIASVVADGATIGEASTGTLLLGGTAALTGGGAAYLDNGACASGSKAACFGRDLGLVGAAAGTISTLGTLGPIVGIWQLESLPDAVFQGLGWFSATFGAAATVFDTTTTAASASPLCPS